MLKALILGLLYFIYFYNPSSKKVPKPTSGVPSLLPPFHVSFTKSDPNTFQFVSNNTVLWEHAIPEESYLVHRGSDDIIQKDPCYYATHGISIPATGQALYDYLKRHPGVREQLAFQEKSPYTVTKGGIFYFTCMDRKIDSLGVCPSGHVFQKSTCIAVSSCTGRYDGTVIPDPPSHYYVCKNGRAFREFCGNGKFFYHDRCLSKDDPTHACKFYTKPIRLDHMTLLECTEDGKPVQKRCAPGTQLFERDVCEPTDCLPHPDGTKLPLPERREDPFHFAPGYMTCFGGKVRDTVECPQVWDDTLTQGDNLTHLPMVFDGHRCAVPSFCDNVYSEDPDVVVPNHEFTKHVRNWKWSTLYDTAVGGVRLPRGS